MITHPDNFEIIYDVVGENDSPLPIYMSYDDRRKLITANLNLNIMTYDPLLKLFKR